MVGSRRPATRRPGGGPLSDGRYIAVFGSSEPGPTEPLYVVAYRLGQLLARAGFAVLSGGYGGVMEGASRGARDAGGRTAGVTCATFRDRRPNLYLDEVVVAPDLFARTRELVERARGYVVLPGKAGTLAEIAILWALERAGCLGARPVVLLGGRFGEMVAALREMDVLEPSQCNRTRIVDRPEDAVAILCAAFDAATN